MGRPERSPSTWVACTIAILLLISIAGAVDAAEDAALRGPELEAAPQGGDYQLCPTDFVPCACGAYGAHRRHEEQEVQLSHEHHQRYVNPPSHKHHCCCPAPPTCSGAGGACSNATTCCAILTQTAVCSNSECCLPGGNNCTFGTIGNTQCCSGECLANGKCDFSGCKAGDTRVRIQESPTLVALRDVKTGQHVQCVDASDDMRTPTQLAWCEVHNWAHAKAVTYRQTRLSFKRPSGEQGHLTLSANHLLVKLTNPSLPLGRSEPRVDAFGSFSMAPAGSIRPGDKVAVLTDDASAEAGFTAVAITAVDHVEAEGMYAPALDKPFIVADGVVTSVWNEFEHSLPMVGAPAGLDGVKHALTHYLAAPAYTQRFEPIDTPGTASKMTEHGMWPGEMAINEAVAQRVAAGEAINFKAVQEWWRTTYAARSAATPAASLEDTLALLKSDAAWVKQPGGGRSSPAS